MFCAGGLCRHMLLLVLMSSAMMGLGIGTLVVSFQVVTEATLLEFVVCYVSFICQ